MGMSATQARLLSLQARQSNLEYQGQQINQERTILSQQCTSLYNSLLSMTVPTPPSTNDFTTVQYAGTDGASKFTLGTIKPDGESYIVERKISAHGHSLSKNFGTSVVGKAGAKIKGEVIPHLTKSKPTGNYHIDNDSKTGEYNKGDYYVSEKAAKEEDLKNAKPEEYMVMDPNTGLYKKAEKFEPNQSYYKIVSPEDYNKMDEKAKADVSLVEPEMTEPEGQKIDSLDSYYILDESGNLTPLTEAFVEKNEDGTYTLKDLPDNLRLFKEGAGTTEYTNPNAGATTIQGKEALNFEEAKSKYPDVGWGEFEEAIRNSFGEEYDKNNFYVFVSTSDTGKPVIQFALKDDVDSYDGFTETFSYAPNGEFTESKMEQGCKLEFDTDGRITKMSIPVYDKVSGEAISYQDIDLIASTVTDSKAYQDAYNQYEYAQHEYDKKNKEINAKTEIIQREDRNLELKLQRLDNERTQIKTEIEACKKVCNDNIEGSYKTFSG